MCTMGEPSALYAREDDISSSSLSKNLPKDRRRASPRKGATRKYLSIILKIDGDPASFGFPEGGASKVE